MNQSSTSTWSPMVSGPEEDFASFLEFGDLQSLTFPAFEANGGNEGSVAQELTGGLGTETENDLGMMKYKQGQMDQHLEYNDGTLTQISLPEIDDDHDPSESLLDIEMQAQIYQQQQEQEQRQQQQQRKHQQAHMPNGYHGQGIVPPTPNSIEMHGGQLNYYPQVDSQTQAIYHRYARNQKDQMVFTPLVSPAVTPLDTQFCMPEYTVPGEYFSPLTSPALEAQNHASQRSIYSNIRSSEKSNTTSPVEMSIDASSNTSNPNPSARKSRRKNTSFSLKTPSRAVRQSPAMKPQTKKIHSCTVIPPREVAEFIEDAQKAKQNGNGRSNGKFPFAHSQDSSETDSISPEPLYEALMPPPKTPRSGSSGRSPYLLAKQPGSQSAPLLAMNSEPATPASLMRIQKPAQNEANKKRQTSSLKEQTLLAEANMEQIMEDIILPESARGSRPNLQRIDTSISDDQLTPTLIAKQPLAAKLQSAPPSATCAAFPSPQTGSTRSPTVLSSSKRPELKPTGRGIKKRNSTSSSHVSPSLRPKVSPSIKPLLPEGATVTAETTALLLASKSNYQNILEGTHPPGVSYPEALSTNLTSKRTSHKIAEQGRRNRINSALQEIASLLPSTTPQPGRDGSSGSGGDVELIAPPVETNLMTGTAAQQSNSKATTVEMAIEYIKTLQHDLKDVKGRLDEAEKRLWESESNKHDMNVQGETTDVEQPPEADR